MDVSSKTRVLQRITSECLRSVRATSKLPPDAADQYLRRLPADMRKWSAELEAAAPEGLIRELPEYEGYSRWASSYDNDPTNRVILAEQQVIWDTIGSVDGRRVLDVGCGTGRHTIPLSRMGATVVASEPNDTFRAMARAKDTSHSTQIQWLPFDIDHLPTSLGKFDLVLCCLVLSHVADLDGSLVRLSQYVADGGAIIVTDFHPFNLLIGWRTTFLAEGERYVVPNFVHLPSHYFEAMRRAGLEIEVFREVGDFPYLPDQPATIIMKGRRRGLPDLPTQTL